MSLANLTDLKTAIGDWLYRAGDTALAARAEDLIALFEADFLIDPDMRSLDMEEVDTTVINGGAFALPAGYLDMKLVRILGGAVSLPDWELSYVTPSRAAQLDNTQSPSGTVKNYTVRAGRIFLAPKNWAPTGATLELTYNKFVKLADADAGANWLLLQYPNLYLYGSLMQGAAYVDDQGAVNKWKTGRDEAMAKFARTIIKKKLGAGPLVMSPSSASFK